MYFVKIGYHYINMKRVTGARLTPDDGVYVYDGSDSGFHLEGGEAAQMRALLTDLAVPDVIDDDAEFVLTPAGRAQARQYEDGPHFDGAAEAREAAAPGEGETTNYDVQWSPRHKCWIAQPLDGDNSFSAAPCYGASPLMALNAAINAAKAAA